MQTNFLYKSLSYQKLRRVLAAVAVFFSVFASHQVMAAFFEDPGNGKCLDSNDGYVYPNPCYQNEFQKWELNYVSSLNNNPVYSIKHPLDGRCLAITKNTSNVVTAACYTGYTSQLWERIGNKFKNRFSGQCLESNDAYVWTVSCDWNQSWQDWKVWETPIDTVAFFDNANYGYLIVSLGIGNYDLRTWKNDALSSLRIPSGLRVTLYEHENFSGRQKVLSSDTNYVGDDFNDITTSVKIEKITTPSNCIASGALNGNPLNSKQYFNAAQSFANYYIDKGLGNFPFFGGGYQVRLARHNMQCVNVKGGWPYDGGDVIVYPCTNTIFYPVHEQWDFKISRTTGFGAMSSRITDGETRRGMCTEAQGAGFTGSQLWNKLTRNCNGNDNQQFALLPIRGTEFLLYHKGSQQCMRYDGSKLRTAECNKDDPEQMLQLCKPGEQCISPPAYICP